MTDLEYMPDIKQIPDSVHIPSIYKKRPLWSTLETREEILWEYHKIPVNEKIYLTKSRCLPRSRRG